MKAYKGFNSQLQCTPGNKKFQFEVGKTYEEPTANLCNSGFHACESPLDVFGHYAPGDGSRYCEVDLDGVTDQHSGDSKRVGNKITITGEIGIPGLIKAHIEWVKAHITNEHTDPKAATAGDSGAATAGACGAATAGDCGAAMAGNRGAATSRGSVSVGENGIGLVRGNGVKAKGGIGAILVLCEENEGNYAIKAWKAIEVDGENIKADTFYMLKNRSVVECDSNA